MARGDARALAKLGIDGDVAARLVFAAIDGLTLQQLIFEDPEQTREAVACSSVLLRLLAADGDAAAR